MQVSLAIAERERFCRRRSFRSFSPTECIGSVVMSDLKAIILQLHAQHINLPISVIVVNFNRRTLLRACLESLTQQRGVLFEVVLVDNGSEDGSAEMAAEEFGDHSRFPLQVIRNNENRGFCAANNQGIAASAGEFVALLNN